MNYIYKNGNYIVYFDSDICKLVKRTLLYTDNELISDFPDSIDLKITNKCSWGCPFCHESSCKNGESFNFNKTIKILSKLPKNPIEIAIGGGDVFEELDLTTRLIKWLIKRNFRPRITINYKNLIKTDYSETDIAKIKDLIDLLIDNDGGIGISINSFPTELGKMINYESTKDSEFPLLSHIHKKIFCDKGKGKVVFHVIYGIFPSEDLEKLIVLLKTSIGTNIPILVLGYKQWGRAKDTNIPVDKKFIDIIRNEYNKDDIFYRTARWFVPIFFGFDNLAIEQLGIRDFILEKDWSKLYMGDEGSHSMYVDAVKGEFARNSRSPERTSWKETDILTYFKSLSK